MATKWSREPVELPAGYTGSFTILALAGTSPKNLWLLGQAAAQSGLGIMLFKRNERQRAKPAGKRVDLARRCSRRAATPAQGRLRRAPLTARPSR